MSRTLSGKLTGKAAQGVDELDIPATAHYDRLTEVTEKVKGIFANDLDYIHWLVNIPEGKMLEYCEAIIQQDAEWNAELTGVSEPRTVDVTKYFGGITATASKTWAEKHLNGGSA